MKSIDLNDFYNLGIALARLKSLPENNCSAATLVMTSLGVGHTLKKLLAGDRFDVGVAKGPGQEFVAALEKLDNEYSKDSEGNWRYPEPHEIVQPWEVSSLQRKLTAFEHVLAAHTKQAATYYAAKIGIFETGDLVERAEHVFPSDIRNSVPKSALDEYRSAGRALAFDMPTACAFHVARAIEIVLRVYRDKFVRTPAGKTMGAIIRSLEQHAKNGVPPLPSARTLRQIDQIRDLDRNRIMHPEDTFTADLALIMFFNGISAITAMISEIRTMP